MCEALKLNIYNLFKYVNVIKFNNDFSSFKEDRDWQINSWRENQRYFLNFLEDNNLSKLYAYGSIEETANGWFPIRIGSITDYKEYTPISI